MLNVIILSVKGRYVECHSVTNLNGVMFASVIHELCFTCFRIILNKDTTLWLDGASTANTCAPPSFQWIALHINPSKTVVIMFLYQLIWMCRNDITIILIMTLLKMTLLKMT